MSIIRLSCIRETLYAPQPSGVFVAAPYDRNKGTGKMDVLSPPTIPSDTSPLRDYMRGQISEAAPALGDEGPVVVMVHGYQFEPKDPVTRNPRNSNNAHARIFHFQDRDEAAEQKHHTTSWPRHLGLADNDGGASGLAIAFAWDSNPGFLSSVLFHSKDPHARAYRWAERTAWPLVAVLHELNRNLPNHRIDVLTHSLGTRLVLYAIALATIHRPRLLRRIDRVIMMGSSEFVSEAQRTYQAARGLGLATWPDFYNVVIRKDTVLDKLAERISGDREGSPQVVGHNGIELGDRPHHWMDLQLDNDELRDWLGSTHGVDVAGDAPGKGLEHWYYFTYRANMDFYRRILHDRDELSQQRLRSGPAPIPEGVVKHPRFPGDPD